MWQIKKMNLHCKFGDYLLSLTVLSQFFLTALQSFLLYSGILSEGASSTLRIAGSILFVILSVGYVLRRSFLTAIMSYGLVLSLFSLSMLQNQSHLEYILSDGVRFTLCTCLPIFLSFASIRNFSAFLQVALWISLATSAIGILFIYFYFTGRMFFFEGIYNMSFGYSLLFPTLFLFSRRKFFFTLLAIILTIIILLLGSRGPLVPIILFVFLQRMILGTVKERIFLTAFILIFILFLPVILEYLALQGIESRTLNLLISGEAISHDSGREALYDIVKEKILENPLLGYGIFADRIFCNGIYCHNLFLEAFIDFGCIFPLLLFIYIALKSLFLLKHLSKDNMLLFLLITLSAIIPLLVTGSYLTDFRFFLFLGYLNFLFLGTNKIPIIHETKHLVHRC